MIRIGTVHIDRYYPLQGYNSMENQVCLKSKTGVSVAPENGCMLVPDKGLATVTTQLYHFRIEIRTKLLKKTTMHIVSELLECVTKSSFLLLFYDNTVMEFYHLKRYPLVFRPFYNMVDLILIKMNC